MNNIIKHLLRGAVALSIGVQPAHAALLNLATQPLYLGTSIPPVVMINLAKDHQLHYNSYNDSSGLDTDGSL